jgi:hypothetical protein
MGVKPAKTTEQLLSEILEALKDIGARIEFATVAGIFPEPVTARAQNVKWYAPYGGVWFNREPTSLKAGGRVKLVDFKGAGRIDYAIVLVENTPDVEFVITVDGFEVEDWSIHEYHDIGMDYKAPMYGGYTVYDDVNKIYGKYSLWMWNFGKSLKVELWNVGDTDAVIDTWDVQFFSRV